MAIRFDLQPPRFIAEHRGMHPGQASSANNNDKETLWLLNKKCRAGV